MARAKKIAAEISQEEKPVETVALSNKPVSLAKLLSKRPVMQKAEFWVIGDTPLITHAWSEKAKREMLSKQVKATKAGREARDPNADFLSSLYEMYPGQEVYGFPVTGLKNAILSCAHKDKGIARTAVMSALWLNAEMVRVRPALAGAVCDMPLVRIWGSKPEMREDMVRVGVGLNKTASLAYRGQFKHWAFKISAELNGSTLTHEALAFLIIEAGRAVGLGEWRNEKKGMFGAFHLGSEAEEKLWESFIIGKGPLPMSSAYTEEFKEAAE